MSASLIGRYSTQQSEAVEKGLEQADDVTDPKYAFVEEQDGGNYLVRVSETRITLQPTDSMSDDIPEWEGSYDIDEVPERTKQSYRWNVGDHSGHVLIDKDEDRGDALDEVMELLEFHDIEANRSDVTIEIVEE